jgi:hypothetical protein
MTRNEWVTEFIRYLIAHSNAEQIEAAYEAELDANAQEMQWGMYAGDWQPPHHAARRVMREWVQDETDDNPSECN